jgi:hypothetical protein
MTRPHRLRAEAVGSVARQHGRQAARVQHQVLAGFQLQAHAIQQQAQREAHCGGCTGRPVRWRRRQVGATGDGGAASGARSLRRQPHVDGLRALTLSRRPLQSTGARDAPDPPPPALTGQHASKVERRAGAQRRRALQDRQRKQLLRRHEERHGAVRGDDGASPRGEARECWRSQHVGSSKTRAAETHERPVARARPLRQRQKSEQAKQRPLGRGDGRAAGRRRRHWRRARRRRAPPFAALSRPAGCSTPWRAAGG